MATQSRMPHAFLVASAKVHAIVFIAPGGFLEAVSKMNVPAMRMEVPIDVDAATYANADLTETIKVFERHGVRFLSADEIRTEMPQYPVVSRSHLKWVPSNS